MFRAQSMFRLSSRAQAAGRRFASGAPSSAADTFTSVKDFLVKNRQGFINL